MESEKTKLDLFSVLPRSECGTVLLTLICQNSFGDKTFFTGAVPLIDADTGLSSRFLSAHPEEPGDISDAVAPAPGQNNHGFSDPRPPLPFTFPRVSSQDVLHRISSISRPWALTWLHYWPLQKAVTQRDACAFIVVWRGTTWVALLSFWVKIFNTLFLGSTTCRRMHLAQQSWWSFCFACRKGRDFENITYCSSGMCWPRLH